LEIIKLFTQNGLLTVPADDNIIRLAPPLIILKKEVDEKDIWKIYRAAFGEEPFIRLIRDKNGLYKFPDPKFVVGSNFCDIGFELDEDNNRLIALSASDNLMKGAAGSAVQNMNIMSGFDEKQGIMYSPLTPV